MQLLLDSAVLEEARQAAAWGWVRGATTNPALLAKSSLPPEKILKKLGKLFPGEIFYQLTGKTVKAMKEEAKIAANILGRQLVLKIPAVPLGFKACVVLSGKYTCAITSLFTPAQALVANAAGARYALYYHNRAKKLLPDGANLPRQIADVLKRTDTILVAASLKSPDELVEARLAGARILSAPFEVLKELPTNEHAQAALDDFDARGVGLINNIKEQQ